MKGAEIAANKYLLSIFNDVQYEPIKNESPDFLCDKKVAVEVRLLNQHFEINGRHQGLQQTEFPLRDKLLKIYRQFDRSTVGQSWFVHHEFWRPMVELKEVSDFVLKTLSDFSANPQLHQDHQFRLGTLKLTISPRSDSDKCLFVLGGWIDYDSGGFTASEVGNNLDICVREKAQKIQKNYAKFQEWWLLLVDEIGDAASVPGWTPTAEYSSARKSFNKVILVDRDGVRSLDI